MVTLIKYGALSGGEKYNVNVLNIDGLSTDTKPTVTYIEYGSDGREVGRMGIPNGSLYTEIDTGDTYMYDADNTTWHKVSIGGGGGGTQGGIVLVGETTTALTDEATTNPITVDGQSYTAQPNDAVIYGSKEFLFDGTKWHEFGDLSGLASKDIGAMTGYAKASTGSAIATTDTLNQAIGKVEKRVEVNENNILSEQAKTTGMDNGGDNYISINGIPIYCDTSEPNGVIIPNALGIGWGSGTHTYTVGDNLFNYKTMAVSATNVILDASGTEIESENWVISDYIPCSGTSFTIGYIGGNTPAICLYDKDKQFITGKAYNTGGASSKGTVNITSQSTAKYIRFSYCLAGGASYVDISTIMLNKGNSLQSFVAFSGAWT